MTLQRAYFVLAIPQHTLEGDAIESKGRRRRSLLHNNASIPCDVFLVLLFCEEHHGLPFSLIEASLSVGVSSLLGRVLEDQVSMMHVPSGGADQFMAMQFTAWCAYSGVEAHKYYV